MGYNSRQPTILQDGFVWKWGIPVYHGRLLFTGIIETNGNDEGKRSRQQVQLKKVRQL